MEFTLLQTGIAALDKQHKQELKNRTALDETPRTESR
jgi:hypothetical protein